MSGLAERASRERLRRSAARNRCDSSTFTIVTIEELTDVVARGEVDTVLLAMTDMQGRLQGKRLTATHFLEEVAEWPFYCSVALDQVLEPTCESQK